ncbi:energy transducer TonB [Sphingomicrobium clamense]|uniref:Energy transducer TonB n=1 Tax=Sphingomicrobium clamense TaxID=2851013 RepID=A0ABS6V2V7_9SPHN|nr:energy transducer TonB [Sphingomicrobium sp. B8]MBW0143895.1 energy transducer TonB [Sphingomicrobium sp. B8]
MLAYAPPRESARKSPSVLTIVIGIHVAGLAALMAANPQFVTTVLPDNPEVRFVPQSEPPPPPDPVPPQSSVQQPTTQALPTPPIALVPLPIDGPTIATDTFIDIAPPAEVGTVVDLPNLGTPAPVRTEGRLKTPPHRLKPEYPASKRRLGEEAVLRLRLDIDAVGRVTKVTPLGSFDSAFLSSAERHILRHWRYEPATLGGDAIADTTVVSLEFKLDD